MMHHRASRSFLALIAAVALTCCQTEQAAGSAFEEAPPIAQLEFRTGTVALERGPSRAFAELGYVLPNDTFETGPGSTMQLRFPSGGTVEVGPDARLSVTEDKAGSAVKASRGNYVARMPRRPPTREPASHAFLTLQTPFGFTRCESDSEISVQVTEEAARVQIAKGKVEVGSKTGRTMSGSAGDQFLLSSSVFERAPIAPPGGVGPKEPAPASGFQVRSLAGDGQADVRRRDAQRWTKISSRGEKLGERDVLRIWEGSWAMDWGSAGARLVASDGTELSAEKLETTRDGVEPAVSLLKGEVALSVENPSPERIAISGLHLGAQAPGFFIIAKTSDGFELTALAGDLAFKKEGVEGTVLAGQMVTVHGTEKAIVEELDRADLALAARFGCKVFHQGLDWVALTWEGGKRDYRVEVASDSAFSQTVLRGTVHRPFVNVPAPSRGSLFWRVLEADGKATHARGGASFSAEVQTRDSTRTRNEVPDGPEKTTIHYDDKAPEITFTYRTEPSAAKYRVAVYRATALDKPIAEQVVSQNSAAFDTGVLNEGSYLWSVTPIAASGEELGGGRMNKLELVYESSVPTLVVRSPRNGELVKGNRVVASGMAPGGSRVLVNGKPAALDEKNRFELAVAPVGRPPLAIFRLLRTNEPEVVIARVLRRAK